MKLEDLKIYSMSMQLGDEVWQTVVKWDYFQKDTVGKQWVKSVDSVAATSTRRQALSAKPIEELIILNIMLPLLNHLFKILR